MTYNNIGRLDLLLLGLRAPHGLLDLDRPPDLPVDASVEEDQAAVGEQLGEEGLGHEVVVDDVVLARPEL